MKIDVSKSEYHERPDVRDNFNRSELRKMRVGLRRLRFLEQQVRERGGLSNPEANGGAAFAEMELEFLEFVLRDMEFIK